MESTQISSSSVQQSAAVAAQVTAEGQLNKALEKLTQLPMPPDGKRRSAPPVAESGALAPVEARTPVHVPEAASVEEESSAPAPAPPPPPAQTWGPQQQRELQQILHRNDAMESELKTLREQMAQTEQYRAMVEDAQAGDIRSFAAKAKLSDQDIMDALGNKTSVTRPYVKRVENSVGALSQKVENLERLLAERDQQARQERDVAEISQRLQVKSEYDILKHVPDVATRIRGLISEREALARNRGEVAPSFSIEDAASELKSQIIGSLKKLIADEAIKKELGLMGDSESLPESVKPSRPTKAITGRMSAQGAQPPKAEGYDPAAQLRRALKNNMR